MAVVVVDGQRDKRISILRSGNQWVPRRRLVGTVVVVGVNLVDVGGDEAVAVAVVGVEVGQSPQERVQEQEGMVGREQDRKGRLGSGDLWVVAEIPNPVHRLLHKIL